MHRSADLRRAVNDLVMSKSFDNGMICASEQAVILDTEVHDEALAAFRTLHAHVATAEQKALLEEFLFPPDPAGEGEPRVNPAAVGRSPAWIAEQAGFTVPEDTSVLLVKVDSVGAREPLTREKLCPVLAVLRARTPEEGFELAAAVVDFHGQGHTAVIHTTDTALAEEYGHRMRTVRVLVNAPSALGGDRRDLQRVGAVLDPRLRLMGGTPRCPTTSPPPSCSTSRRSAPGATTSSGSRSRRRSTSSRGPSAIWRPCRTSTGSPSSPTPP
ncbi:hypothetical protein GCM10020000_04660 [Streptomyces olivoverticillatus]